MPAPTTFTVEDTPIASRAQAFAVAGERALRNESTVYVRPANGGAAVGYAEWVDDHVELHSNTNTPGES